MGQMGLSAPASCRRASALDRLPARNRPLALLLAREGVRAVEGPPTSPGAVDGGARPLEGVARGADPVLVDVRLIGVGLRRAVVVRVTDPVLVAVAIVRRVAGVAESVAVDVLLAGVRVGGAVVGCIGGAVAVSVAATAVAVRTVRVLVAGV